jgi:hypothetical protein
MLEQRRHSDHWPQEPAGCRMGTLSRLKTLVVAIISSSAAICRSS